MSIADKILAFANEKENIRFKLGIPKDIPFSEYSKYLQWQGGMTIPNKSFYADFTNNRYVKDGVPCNFKDLFTFNRTGKAWLVKDTGLQEYAADVPRFDNGLLIEQSATNYHSPSYDMTLGNRNGLTFTNFTAPDGVIYEQKVATVNNSNRYQYQLSNSVLFGKPMSISWYVSRDSGSITPLENVVNTATVTSSKNINVVESVKLSSPKIERHQLYLQSVDTPTESIFWRFYIRDSNIGDGFWGWQVEQGKSQSSYIKTTTAPVTRPADFLQARVTGTTVTGDWDSTLSLSIVNGQIVHSGYGRIRSLEIN